MNEKADDAKFVSLHAIFILPWTRETDTFLSLLIKTWEPCDLSLVIIDRIFTLNK